MTNKRFNRDAYERDQGTYRQPRYLFRKLMARCLPKIPGFRIRRKLYHYMGYHIDPKVKFIGLDVYIDDHFPELIYIEEDVIVSLRATILAHDDVSRTVAPVRICRGAFIGAGAIVLSGVCIGEGAVVGAGAVVTHDVDANTKVAGVPARKLE